MSMRDNDTIFLENEYKKIVEANLNIDPKELAASMMSDKSKEKDLYAPYAVIYHGQALEWYGDGDPASGNGRYKPKGNCGHILAINVPTKSLAEQIARHMINVLRDKYSNNVYGKNIFLCDWDNPIALPMTEVDFEYMDPEIDLFVDFKNMSEEEIEEYALLTLL